MIFWVVVVAVMEGAGTAAAAEKCSAPAPCGGSPGQREQPFGAGQQGSIRQPVGSEGSAAGAAHRQVRAHGSPFVNPKQCQHVILPHCSSLRKLLEQREEELQQQVRSLRLKEASLSRTNTELSHRVQQLDIRLSISETELSKTREEVQGGLHFLRSCSSHV